MGCSTSMYTRKNQSHFDYPNSNITPLSNSNVTGVYKTGLSLKPPTITSEVERLAYNDALIKVNGADMIINIDYEWKVTIIPIYVLQFYIGTLTVSGQPVSMEIGNQILSEAN